MKSKQLLLSSIAIAILASGCSSNSAPQQNIASSQPVSVTAIQVQPVPSDAVVIKDQPVSASVSNSYVGSVKKIKGHKQGSSKNFLANNSFDFAYSGDVSGIPYALKEYDPTIKVLPALGTKKSVNIGINLDSTDIGTIQTFIDQNTNGRAKLSYTRANNSLRIIYNSKTTVAQDAVHESLKWQDGATPSPVLSKDGLVLFPYGQYQPKITCQPLQLCDIQLQAGEVVKGIMIGDSVRWNEGDGSVPVVYSGSDSAPVPHVVLKPTYPGLQTSLLVTTDKRTYYMQLLSSNSTNLSRAGFYYPEQQIQQMENNRADAKAKSDEVLNDGDMPSVDPRNMHFDYKVSGDTSAKFKPVQVFDDGTNVYIQMPSDIKQSDLPAFYVLGQDGEKLELVNFQFKRPYYVVHKIFDKGVLILGLDDNAQQITITHKVKSSGFWSGVFGD